MRSSQHVSNINFASATFSEPFPNKVWKNLQKLSHVLPLYPRVTSSFAHALSRDTALPKARGQVPNLALWFHSKMDIWIWACASRCRSINTEAFTLLWLTPFNTPPVSPLLLPPPLLPCLYPWQMEQSSVLSLSWGSLRECLVCYLPSGVLATCPLRHAAGHSFSHDLCEKENKIWGPSFIDSFFKLSSHCCFLPSMLYLTLLRASPLHKEC